MGGGGPACFGVGESRGVERGRVLGKKWGLLVIVMDAAKGAVAGLLGLAIGDAAAYAAGTGVIAGHCWPVWNGFRGGKGVAAAGGSFFTVFPPMVPIDGLATAAVRFLDKRAPGDQGRGDLGGLRGRVVGRRLAHVVGPPALGGSGDLLARRGGDDPGPVRVSARAGGGSL